MGSQAGPELRHLRYLLAVADEKHFGRAAQRMSITQPSLSRQIRDLEHEVGAELLRRTSHGVEMTPAGEVMVRMARDLLGRIESAMEGARLAASGDQLVRVSAPLSILLKALPDWAVAVQRASPNVRVEIIDVRPAAQPAELLARRLDVGFVRGAPEDRDIETECIGASRLVAAVPRSHALASRDVVTLAELAREPFIVLSDTADPLFTRAVLQLVGTAHVPMPVVAARVGHLELLGLVAIGVGVSIVPAALDQSVRPDRVATVAIEGAPTMPTLMIWRRGDASRGVTAFLGTVRAHPTDV